MTSVQYIRWSESLDYGFAVGRVRSLETLLLDRNQYERLIRTNGVEGFIAALAETRYGQLMSSEADVNMLFLAVHQENILFCQGYAKDAWLKALIQMPADIFNLKVMLKNRYLGKNTRSNELLSGGGWSVKELNAITSPEAPRLPVEKRDFVLAWRRAQEALRLAEEKQDPAVIDLVLDRLAQELALRWTTGKDFALGYYRLFADVTNLKTLIRVKVLNEGVDTFRTAFLPGGTIAFEQLQRVYELESSALNELRIDQPFLTMLQIGVRVRDGNESVLPIEKKGRELLLDYINQARYVALGYEPLWRFYLLRENELTNLRQLYAAKVAGWDIKQCQEVVVYDF